MSFFTLKLYVVFCFLFFVYVVKKFDASVTMSVIKSQCYMYVFLFGALRTNTMYRKNTFEHMLYIMNIQ